MLRYQPTCTARLCPLTIRVGFTALGVGDLHTTNYELVALCQAVEVKAMSDAVWQDWGGGRFDCCCCCCCCHACPVTTQQCRLSGLYMRHGSAQR